MEFASKYAYNYGGESSCESDDEADDILLNNEAPQNIPLASVLNQVDLTSNVCPAPPPPPGNAPSSTRSVDAPIQPLSQTPNAPPPPLPASGSSGGPRKPPPPPDLYLKKIRKKKVRKTDTNVLSVKFGCLEEKTFTSASKPVKCSQCPAVMSNLEHLVNDLNGEKGDTSMNWICSFCGATNSVAECDAKTERKEDMLYVPEDQVLEPEKKEQPEVKKEGEKSVDLEDDSILLFTLDISGSMGATVCQRGQMKDFDDDDDDVDDDSDSPDDQSIDDNVVDGSKRRRSFFSNFFTNRITRPKTSGPLPARDQIRVNQRTIRQSNNDYLSRLDIMKAALIQRLKDMKTTKPNVKLGVVTFCTEVNYLADGTPSKQKSLCQSAVNDKDAIQKVGIACKPPGPLKQSADRMKTAVKGMQPVSMTALGPALLMSVAIAGQQNQSKVIICTDGMANVGIGELSGDSPNDDFYDYVSEYANEFGVSVSVLSIEGADCRLTCLGRVADATNGSVNIVNPKDLGAEYAGIISQKIVGSKVEVTLVLHTSMYIRDALNPNDKSKSWMKLSIGNVTSDSENYFEFGFKPKQSGDKNEDDDLKEVPFQLQISYVNKHKSQLLRVITAKMPCTKERSKAEEEADMVLMGAHAVQSTAQISKEREYTMANINACSKKAWFTQQKRTRGSNFTPLQTKAQATTISELDSYGGYIFREQQDEALMFGGNLSDVDDDLCPTESSVRKQKKREIRARTQKDSSANMMFRNAKINKSALMKK